MRGHIPGTLFRSGTPAVDTLSRYVMFGWSTLAFFVHQVVSGDIFSADNIVAHLLFERDAFTRKLLMTWLDVINRPIYGDDAL